MENWAAEDSFEDSQILYSEIRRCAGESTSCKEMESNAERDKEKSKNSVPRSNDAYSADEAEHETLKDRGLSGVELQDQPKALETRLKNAHIEDEAQNETSKDNGLSGVELQDQTSLDKSGNESGEETEDEHGKFVERASESKTVLEQATQVAAQPRGQVNSRPVAVKENELDLTSSQRMEVNRVTALISVDSAPSSPILNAHIEDEAQNETSKDNGLSGVELQDQTSLDKSGNESGEETEDEHGKFVERASESKTVLEQATQVAAQPRGQVNSRPVAVKENELDLTSSQRMEVNRVTALISVDSAPSSPILLPKSSGAQHVVHDLKTTKAEAELQDGVEGQKIESKDREEEMPECQNVRASKKRRRRSMSRVNEQLDETQKGENREELQQ